MFNRKTRIVLLLFILLTGVLMGSVLVNSQIRKINDPLNRLSASSDGALSTIFTPASTFHAVMRAMNTEYVDKITPEFEGKMSVNLVKGMLREMGDQNTRYVEPDEAQILVNANKGIFEGIGVRPVIKPVEVDGIKEEQLFVGSVIPGSNAMKAGLAGGDVIIKVDGKSILPYNPLARAEKALNDYRMKPDASKQKELQKYLEAENDRIDKGIQILEAEKLLERGTDGAYTLTVRNNNNKEREVKVSCGKYSLKPLETRDIGEYRYIRVNYITDTFASELEDAMDYDKKALVLDLRDVFGGNSDGAIASLGIFLPDMALFRVTGQRNRVCKTKATEREYKGKLLILVNGGTSRCSELMAIALKAYYPGTVVCGSETAGELTELTYFTLDNGGGFTMTTGKYNSARNKALTAVKPDIAFSGDPSLVPDTDFIAKALGR